MTGRELHRHRVRLGFRTLEAFGQAVGLQGKQTRRTVSRWEGSECPVPGYVERLIDAFYTGWRPKL